MDLVASIPRLRRSGQALRFRFHLSDISDIIIIKKKIKKNQRNHYLSDKAKVGYLRFAEYVLALETEHIWHMRSKRGQTAAGVKSHDVEVPGPGRVQEKLTIPGQHRQ